MTHGNYKTFIFIFLLIVICDNISAQFTQKRIYERTEPAGRESIFEINNKYGKVEITEWSKDSIYIRAEIEASAPNQTRTDRMLEGIEIEITSTKYFVRAQTIFARTLEMFFESLKGMTDKLLSYDSRVQINYYIKIPTYLNIRVDNKYGDVYIDGNHGNVTLSLSNGALKAQSLGKNSTINLSFCNVLIDKAEDCKADASFSDVIIDEADNLTIKSVSSKFEIKKVESIYAESRRDKFYIGSIKTLSGNSYFSTFRIEKLISDADLTTRYGNLTIAAIDNNFLTINLNAAYNDINITFENSPSYYLEIRHINSTVMLPPGDHSVENNIINSDRKEYIVAGNIGRKPGNRKVRIEANRGSIIIR